MENNGADLAVLSWAPFSPSHNWPLMAVGLQVVVGVGLLVSESQRILAGQGGRGSGATEPSDKQFWWSIHGASGTASQSCVLLSLVHMKQRFPLRERKTTLRFVTVSLSVSACIVRGLSRLSFAFFWSHRWVFFFFFFPHSDWCLLLQPAISCCFLDRWPKCLNCPWQDPNSFSTITWLVCSF